MRWWRCYRRRRIESSLYSPVAQSVEQLAVNQLVGGSSPSRGASLDQKRKAFRQCRRAFCVQLRFLKSPPLLVNRRMTCLSNYLDLGTKPVIYKIADLTFVSDMTACATLTESTVR